MSRVSMLLSAKPGRLAQSSYVPCRLIKISDPKLIGAPMARHARTDVSKLLYIAGAAAVSRPVASHDLSSSGHRLG